MHDPGWPLCSRDMAWRLQTYSKASCLSTWSLLMVGSRGSLHPARTALALFVNGEPLGLGPGTEETHSPPAAIISRRNGHVFVLHLKLLACRTIAPMMASKGPVRLVPAAQGTLG